MHVSFLLLLGYWAWVGWQEGGWPGAAINLALIVLLFTCVTLHEFGHSLTAQHFGIGVPRILLLPIGGMAEFSRIPREPRLELLITLAGPAVNFVIAGLLWLGLTFTPEAWVQWLPEWGWEILGQLLYVNLAMGLFNLIPVFPMDGGRIFRSLLSLKLPYLRATVIAAHTGKVLAVAGGLIMWFYFDNPLGAVLFGFIFWAGDKEVRILKHREAEAAHWAMVMERMRRVQEQMPHDIPPGHTLPPPENRPEA